MQFIGFGVGGPTIMTLFSEHLKEALEVAENNVSKRSIN